MLVTDTRPAPSFSSYQEFLTELVLFCALGTSRAWSGWDGRHGCWSPRRHDSPLCALGWRRGCAQVGIIRALMEYGIPVDMVGGTSIGAFMGALYSEERNYSQIRIRAKQWAEVRGSPSLELRASLRGAGGA